MLRKLIKEITTWISSENDIAILISSFDDQIPAIENIQALEDCEFLYITFGDFRNLHLEKLQFNIVGRKLIQCYYSNS